MRLARLLLAGAAAFVAIVLALLAADLRTWRDTMHADDLRFRAGNSAPDWSASTILPRTVAARVLGVDDDRELRHAIALFRDVNAGSSTSPLQRRHLRGEAEAALADVVAQGEATQASQASNLLGILTFADATSSHNSTTPVERSQSAFENAVRLDPDNSAAKANLELLLRLIEARGSRLGSNPGPGPRVGGRRGAGAGTPGRGY